ncbi:MAG: multidrug effflux MFS transporter [Magnetovibrionaceae bacterium]
MKAGSFPFLVVITAVVAFGPVSTDLYLPTLPAIAAALDASVSQSQLTLSLFLAVMGLGQLVTGPLSDRYGRKPVLAFGIGLFSAGSVVCFVAPTIEVLLIGRLIQGLGASCGPVVARAVIRDLFEGDRAARILAYLVTAMAMAPMVAPSLGGLLGSLFGWRAPFGLLLVYGLLLFVIVGLRLPETNRRIGQQTFDLANLFGTYGLLLREDGLRWLALVYALSFSALFTYISASPFVFIEVMGLKPAVFGLVFGVGVGGFIVGGLISGRTAEAWGAKLLLRAGVLITLTGGLIMAALSAARIETVAAVLGPQIVIALGLGLVLPNAMALALQPHPSRAGAASAVVGGSQMGLSALLGAVVGLLHDGTTWPMAAQIGLLSFLAFLAWARFCALKCR